MGGHRPPASRRPPPSGQEYQPHLEHGTIRSVPVLLLLAIAVVILGGVVLAAAGRAGGMVWFPNDSVQVQVRDVSAAEIAMLRPPLSLWGYNAAVTDEMLQQIAHAVSARDVEIATLRRQVEELAAGGRIQEQGTGVIAGHREEQVPDGQRGSS